MSSDAGKASVPMPEAAATTAIEQLGGQSGKGFEVAAGRFIDWLLVEYLRMVTSLLEARRVSLEEVKEMLRRVLRQRSMARHRRIDHIVSLLHEYPP
jgi:hypothetical protein